MPLLQILTAMYVALAEAGGPAGLASANAAIRHLLREGAISDPSAMAFLLSLTEADPNSGPHLRAAA